MSNASRATAAANEPAWISYVKLARIDHWTKNVFVLPGIVVPLSLDRGQIDSFDLATFLFGLFCTCLSTLR